MASCANGPLKVAKGRPRPRTADLRGRHRGDEDELEQDVDDSADEDRADHRAWDVALGVRALARELVGLLEAEQREHDPARGDGREDASGAGRREPVRRGEVAMWRPASASTMIVSTGIATFHHVAALLVLASRRTLRKLIAVKSAISTTAATMPGP